MYVKFLNVKLIMVIGFILNDNHDGTSNDDISVKCIYNNKTIHLKCHIMA